MLVINLGDQLGNQMFAYASMKCIAMIKGYDFRFCRTKLEADNINDQDAKYGTEIKDIFKSISEEEYLDRIPNDLLKYYEHPLKERYSDRYIGDVIEEIQDNTVAVGHFISTAFWKDVGVDRVRSWFVFHDDIVAAVQKKISTIKGNEKESLLVSVHFRCGNDYLKSGFRLNSKYWYQATEYVMSYLKEKQYQNVRIVVLYDKLTKLVEQYIKKYDALVQHGSMVEDMCFISNCDASVICNSSFSIMSAVLNPDSIMTVRPAGYPTESGYLPENVFLPEWKSIGTGKRSFLSQLYYYKKRYFSIPVRKLLGRI